MEINILLYPEKFNLQIAVDNQGLSTYCGRCASTANFSGYDSRTIFPATMT